MVRPAEASVRRSSCIERLLLAHNPQGHLRAKCRGMDQATTETLKLRSELLAIAAPMPISA